MIIELSTGKYLHTAYSITNIPEEMTTLDNEWSLTSQDGMDYIGTFIDGSSTESTDPNDYAWEELIDEDLDDIDEDGDIPVDDFQTQIDELQDQVTVNQDNIRSINASIENVQTNVASNSELSSATADIANATNQHFWTDENGVHVSNEEANAEGERNTIFNSIGMIFRKGANYLTAILAGGASGTDPKGLAIYDGQGNSDENVVASFTDGGSVIGQQNDARTIIGNEEISMINKDGIGTVAIRNSGEPYSQFVRVNLYEQLTYGETITKNIFPYTHPTSHGNFYVLYSVSTASTSQILNPMFYYGTADTVTSTFTQDNSTVEITSVYDGDSTLTITATKTGTLSISTYITECAFGLISDAPSFTFGTRQPAHREGAFSFTAGVGLIASENNEIVLGKFNEPKTAMLLSVGSGANDGARENILELDLVGNLKLAGELSTYNDIQANGDIIASGNITANNHVIGIVETGTTSNSWDYRLWSDGTYEAWRSHGFTGMALTSSSAGTYYGNGTTLGVPTFPNNSNTGVTQCLCTASNAFSHSSGVYLYQTEHASATTATSNLTFQFRAHASTSNAACGLDIYLKGTYA